MKKFAFIIHPLSPRDATRKFPWARFLPDPVIEQLLLRIKPMQVSHITGVRSRTGVETEGWFIGCPLTPEQMVRKVPLSRVYGKIGECVQLAESLGADLIGLGAFTSVVGDGGITIRANSRIGVTTGNSYTVATAIQGTVKACEQVGVTPSNATLAVVGATGSIGKTCARVLGPQFATTLVVGRDLERTRSVADGITNGEATTDLDRIREADVVITVTSADVEVIQPGHLKRGAVVCDVARPRDVSMRVAKERPDVLCIEGGVVRVPGDVQFGFDFGFPAQTAYACMSETMMLALEGDPTRFDFTLGKEVSEDQVTEISDLADKHGFELAGFRAFERAVTEESIERTRQARYTGDVVPRLGRVRSGR